MMQNRSINVSGQGKVEGVISTGDNAKIIQHIANEEADLSEEIMGLLDELAKRYSAAAEFQKQTVLQMELQNKLKSDPTFRDRFINAAKSGGVELIKVLTNNPFVSVPLETVKGWIETEPV
ncbi:hypothetical protein [Limnofasciculus baicalensis]|uniref:Uncharacterized protein n=1 Tax=Limnofasciculus baicalensis BBK-W-15 TaxID=2699891 RepID=A0AAE3KLW4_9CYAN|nr:hypothetical protein [Limnofasciculus baicalensis]MCP2728549.1 hypothetical protein [Limnofasciculus baicalensis BBK-W-15]